LQILLAAPDRISFPLLASVYRAALSTSVPPPVGKFQVDEDGIANVGLNAPVKVRFPLSVAVKDPLLTPVPP
jgi:hypothetical protein